MDILKNKKYEQYNYLCRYLNVPYYYNTVDEKEIYGIGKNLLQVSSYTLHKVQQDDTLDYLSLKYYNDPTFWWVISYYNNIQDAFIDLKDNYDTLKIPNILTLEFGDLR